MSNKPNWLWSLKDKDKAMQTRGFSPALPQKTAPLPTVENNQKKRKPETQAITKTPGNNSWNDRLFLEGFYEVDGTTNDWERKERISQVETALKDIERRRRRSTPGTSVRTITPERIDTSKIQKLPYDPNAPAQITNLPYQPDGRRYPAYTNYRNASNKNTVQQSNSTARTPTKEEFETIYREVKEGKLQQDLRDKLLRSITAQMMTGPANTGRDSPSDERGRQALAYGRCTRHSHTQRR